jgi:hypothetical protein
MSELWKDVPGYEGKYQASTKGHIRSLTRSITQIGRWGTTFTRVVSGRVLRPASSKRDPHLYVSLGHGANGSLVHQLVAHTFIGPQGPRTDVRHINGDPQDNRVENLCYGSRTQNILDVYRQGKAWRKLTALQADEIKQRLANGERICDLAEIYKVTYVTINSIKTGRSFSCVSSS